MAEWRCPTCLKTKDGRLDYGVCETESCGNDFEARPTERVPQARTAPQPDESSRLAFPWGEFELKVGQVVTLGRKDGDFVDHLVGRTKVSRSHLLIRASGPSNPGGVDLRDDRSVNGTMVDGENIPSGEWVAAQPGSVVELSPDPNKGLRFEVVNVRH